VTRTAWLLAWRILSDRPWRTALLFLGYGVGVAVMIALLSVGEALLQESRDRDLASGGDVVLLPEGVDPAVLKVNGVTGLYFTISHAAFLVREVLLGPRFAGEIAAAAPEIHGRVVYLRRSGRVVPAAASGGIPSLDHAAGVAAAVPGAQDSAADRGWIAPSPAQLFDRLDHFHRPRPAERAAWAEWDYFNFVDPATGALGYLTLLAGGEGRGAVLLRLRRPGRPAEDLALPAAIRPGDLAFSAAGQRIGPARVSVHGGRYHIVVRDPHVQADLQLVPQAGFYLPAGESEEDAVVSGYVVPVVRGRMSGTIHTQSISLSLTRAIAYHDHNWGTWRGVTWDWGEASSARGAALYGALYLPSSRGRQTALRGPALFLWASPPGQSAGFMGVFPIRRITYSGWRPGPVVARRRVPAPSEVTLSAADGPDTVLLRLRVENALGTLLSMLSPPPPPAVPDGAQSNGGGGHPSGGEGRPPRVFLQLRGAAEVRGVIGGRAISWSGPGAAETFVPLP
jgi:hypothetical protein